MKNFEVKFLGEMKWFLGIEIIGIKRRKKCGYPKSHISRPEPRGTIS